MKYPIRFFLAIAFGLLAGCTATEEQATHTVLASHPKSQFILYEAEGETGHYFLCQSNVVLYVRTQRNAGETVSITRTIVLPDKIECGR